MASNHRKKLISECLFAVLMTGLASFWFLWDYLPPRSECELLHARVVDVDISRTHRGSRIVNVVLATTEGRREVSGDYIMEGHLTQLDPGDEVRVLLDRDWFGEDWVVDMSVNGSEIFTYADLRDEHEERTQFGKIATAVVAGFSWLLALAQLVRFWRIRRRIARWRNHRRESQSP